MTKQKAIACFGAIIMLMKGMTLTFSKLTANGKDALGDDTYSTAPVEVADCLVAPITEPATAREQQASRQNKIQVRVHLPKASNADVSDSEFLYGGKTFTVDSDSVVFMPENTPTRWNRYFRAECLNG